MDEAQRVRWRSGAMSGVRGHMWINFIQWLAIDPDRTGDSRFPGTRIGRKVRVRLPAMVMFVCACLASVWWYGGEHEQWMWFGCGLFSVTILVLAGAVERGRFLRRYFVRTVALRQAAARGDDDLSPLVHPQPPLPAVEDMPNVPPMTWAIFRPDAFWSDI